MKTSVQFIFTLALPYILAPESSRAEALPPFDKFASMCVLVVKARHVGRFSSVPGYPLSFEVIETWRGSFVPQGFTSTTPEGYIQANQGEHGVRVTAGQEIVFLYTRHNQPKGTLNRHTTALPIRDGNLHYGSTWDGEYREFTIAEFENAITSLTAPVHAPDSTK